MACHLRKRRLYVWWATVVVPPGSTSASRDARWAVRRTPTWPPPPQCRCVLGEGGRSGPELGTGILLATVFECQGGNASAR